MTEAFDTSHGNETGAAESWSVDPTIRFSHIHVIESLDAGFAGRTGTRLFGEMESWCVGTRVTPTLHRVRTRAEVERVLRELADAAARGDWPLIHFETHGIDAGRKNRRATSGIVLASGESMTWRELAPLLTAINEATRLNLIVFMAACNGADLATLIQPLDGAPVRIVVGPMEVVSAGILETATHAFYRSILNGGDGSAATRAIREALHPNEAMFWTVTAEWLFLEILKAYYNEATTDVQIAARVERFVAPLALQGVPRDEMAHRRAMMKANLADRSALFDACYQKFFFVEKYPENAKRFILSFELCFQVTVQGVADFESSDATT
jgi:hypothetical protein